MQIDQFLKETAAREASAKLRLQQFIEELLERADRAERQLQVISSSCGSTPSASLGRGGGGSASGPGVRGPGRMVSASLPWLLTCSCALHGLPEHHPNLPLLPIPLEATPGVKWEGGALWTGQQCRL